MGEAFDALSERLSDSDIEWLSVLSCEVEAAMAADANALNLGPMMELYLLGVQHMRESLERRLNSVATHRNFRKSIEAITASPDTASVVSEDQHRDQSSPRQDDP